MCVCVVIIYICSTSLLDDFVNRPSVSICIPRYHTLSRCIPACAIKTPPRRTERSTWPTGVESLRPKMLAVAQFGAPGMCKGLPVAILEVA